MFMCSSVTYFKEARPSPTTYYQICLVHTTQPRPRCSAPIRMHHHHHHHHPSDAVPCSSNLLPSFQPPSVHPITVAAPPAPPAPPAPAPPAPPSINFSRPQHCPSPSVPTECGRGLCRRTTKGVQTFSRVASTVGGSTCESGHHFPSEVGLEITL
jgi:hypothetical protein